MNKRRILVRPPGAEKTFLGNETVKENCPPFFCLKYMAVFMPEQRNISNIVRMNKDPDARQSNRRAVLELSDRAGKAGDTRKASGIFAKPD